LTLIEGIQRQHLRNGLTWAQNLWEIGDLVYMSAPVTWFITDVLAGAALDLPGKTLYLAPVVRAGERRFRLPLSYPDFWAVVEGDVEKQSLHLRITRLVSDKQMTLEKLVAVPAGTSSRERQVIEIAPFAIKQDAVLDLSEHWPKLVNSRQEPSILARERVDDLLDPVLAAGDYL
jgi:hypothetical protein